ncbi:hypothetical protein PMAC_003317 [Pneumocystis sp. 'macacae']|nr:hypothetical protein PMAC_003317 [Pneumocystis sp. 'macacae']
MEDEDGIDATSLKEIWKGQKSIERPEWCRWFYGIRSPVTNTELYTLAMSLKLKPPLKSEEEPNYLEKYKEKQEVHSSNPESSYGMRFEQNENLLQEKTSDKNKRPFFQFSKIKAFKKEHSRTLEHDLKTSDPPMFIDMYGTISEDDKEILSSSPVKLLNENIYRKEAQSSIMQEVTKQLYSITKTNILLSKLLDCFSKPPKILETKGTQTSRHTTPITKMHQIYSDYAHAISPITSSVSPQIFMDAKENFSSNSIRKNYSYKLEKKENKGYSNKGNYSAYSGMHSLCQKISLKQSLFPPSTSPCNLYTNMNAKNYSPKKYHIGNKRANYFSKKKIQISPYSSKDTISSQSNIYPFTPFMKQNHQPMGIFNDDTSPDLIVHKELSSPFFNETKTNYSSLQYHKPMNYQSNCTNKQCIKNKSTQNNSLKIKPKDKVIEKKEIPLYKWEKRDDILSINNNIINYQNSIDNFFDTSNLEDKTNSILSFSTMNLDRSNISRISRTKNLSENSFKSIPEYEKRSEKIQIRNKNTISTPLPLNNTKNPHFTEKKIKKKGKVRIPSIFLNNCDKNSFLGSTFETSRLNVSSQNIKVNAENAPLKTNKSIKDFSKKENSKPQNPIISNNKKSSYNKTFALKEDEINISSILKSMEGQASKIYTFDLNRHNPNIIENTKNAEDKHFQISKKDSTSQSKKPLINYSSATCNAPIIVPEEFSKNNKNIEKKSNESFNARSKIIIPPVFLLQKNNSNTDDSVFKKSYPLHTMSSSSTLAMDPLNEKNGILYNGKSNNLVEEFKSINFDESTKVNSLINIKQTCIKNTSFSWSKSINKNNRNKPNPPFSTSFDYKYKCKNNSNSESPDLKKTKIAYSEISIPSDFSIKNTEAKDSTKNMLSRHKHLVSAYEKAVNMSTMSYKVTKTDTPNKIRPNKIIIPSVFTIS